jgi:alpha-L-fucosidase
LTPIPGEDFQAFEKDLPGGNSTGFGGQSVSQLPLETCETMNDSWGFNITDKKYKTTKDLIHYMVNAASLNANFLLNVGPMPDGSIQPEFIATLQEMGDWMRKNGQSIYGTRGGIMKPQEWGVVTAKEKTWYAHIIKTPKQSSYIFIPDLNNKISNCNLLNSKKALKFKVKPEGTYIYLEGVDLDPIDTIIELTMGKLL